MKLRFSVLALSALLSACGGSNNDTPTPPIAPVNQAPVANAGNDISVDEQTPVTLTGQGTDSDGTVASYLWQQTAGTPVTLINTDKAQASFTAPDIKANETLTFSLTVTDNDGATHVDEVSIEVLHVNILPTANAGADIDADEETVVTLSGSASDEDGTITSYNWKQTAGTGAALKNADSSELAIALPDLPQGETLTFELTVTDNSGGTHTDTVDVKVKHLTWRTNWSKSIGSFGYLKIELLDVNSDGILDMLFDQFAEGNRAKVAWSKGKGDGSFAEPVTIARFIDSVINSYSVEDVNGDGSLDLLAAYYDNDKSNNYIISRKIDETDPFSKSNLIYSSAYDEILDYKLADIDAQGKSDLVVATSNGIKWLQKTSNNGFAEGVSITQDWSIKTSITSAGDAILPSHGFTIVDINGDALPDLIMKAILPRHDNILDSSSYIQASVNLGKGVFSLPISLVSNHTEMTVLSSSGSTSYSLLDINNDGIKDVLVNLYFQDNGAKKTTTKWFSFKGEQAKESFVFSPSRYESYDDTGLASLLDWDEDGISDFVLPIKQWSGEDEFMIAFGQGDGVFSEPILVEDTPLSTPFFFFTLDLDLDGKKDLLGYRGENHVNDDGTRSYKRFVFWHKKLVSNIEPAQDLFEYKGEIKGTYDINNDGHIDFVSELDGTLYWYQNQGDLSFVEKTLISTD